MVDDDKFEEINPEFYLQDEQPSEEYQEDEYVEAPTTIIITDY